MTRMPQTLVPVTTLQLQRLRLEAFKRFRQPLEIDGLQPGLNLFAAPNESGKSTIAEAIRVAFLERYRSSWAECLRPWDQGSASPSVTLDFRVGDQQYRLAKSFLGSKKRCDLVIDGKALDGTDAEDHLADLLGYRYAKKGASGADDMGVPGLLWIQQGTSHQLADPVVHAGDYLRGALGQSMGELAASQGDAVLQQVKQARDALMHAGHGAPKGDYAAALKAVEQCAAEVQRLADDEATYRQEVDLLGQLQAAQDQDAAARPWEAVAAKLALAREALAQAQGLAARKADADQQLQQAQAQVKSTRAALDAYTQAEQAVATRQAALARAQARVEQIQASLAGWAPRREQAVQDEQAARERLAQVRLVADRVSKTEAAARSAAAVDAAQEQLARARDAQTQLADLQAQAAAVQVGAPALRQLRETERAWRDAQARLDAAATTLEFDLAPGLALMLDGEPVEGQAVHHLTGRRQLALPGMGSVDIVPGGADLDTLAAERARQADALAAQLQALGAASLAEVEDRAHQHSQLAGQVQARQELLQTYAPRGLVALEAQLASAQAQRRVAEQKLAELAPLPADLPLLPDLAQAERAADAARDVLTQTNDGWQQARQDLSAAQADEATARREFDAAQARVQAPEWTRARAEAQVAVADAKALEGAAQGRVDELARQLQAANLPLLQLDVERLARSVQQLQDGHAERGRRLTALAARLEVAGGLGLEEALAEARQAQQEAQRRADDLGRRARALDHLLALLQARRAALAQRLRAPLQKHLNHYLGILFPGARVEVGDDLAPTELVRAGAHGLESGAYDDLSVGAREQMGVLARLAYADLLREAGRPTLVILDDALVHSDDGRLEQMKRVLFDAAQRHQILLFTCHPQAWGDLGVPVRPLY